MSRHTTPVEQLSFEWNGIAEFMPFSKDRGHRGYTSGEVFEHVTQELTGHVVWLADPDTHGTPMFHVTVVPRGLTGVLDTDTAYTIETLWEAVKSRRGEMVEGNHVSHSVYYSLPPAFAKDAGLEPHFGYNFDFLVQTIRDRLIKMYEGPVEIGEATLVKASDIVSNVVRYPDPEERVIDDEPAVVMDTRDGFSPDYSSLLRHLGHEVIWLHRNFTKKLLEVCTSVTPPWLGERVDIPIAWNPMLCVMLGLLPSEKHKVEVVKGRYRGHLSAIGVADTTDDVDAILNDLQGPVARYSYTGSSIVPPNVGGHPMSTNTFDPQRARPYSMSDPSSWNLGK